MTDSGHNNCALVQTCLCKTVCGVVEGEMSRRYNVAVLGQFYHRLIYKCKGIQDGLRLWIPRRGSSGFQVMDSTICQ